MPDSKRQIGSGVGAALSPGTGMKPTSAALRIHLGEPAGGSDEGHVGAALVPTVETAVLRPS